MSQMLNNSVNLWFTLTPAFVWKDECLCVCLFTEPIKKSLQASGRFNYSIDLTIKLCIAQVNNMHTLKANKTDMAMELKRKL